MALTCNEIGIDSGHCRCRVQALIWPRRADRHPMPCPPRRPQIDVRAGRCSVPIARAVVVADAQHATRSGGRPCLVERRVRLAKHERGPGPYDSRLLRGDMCASRTGPIGVVDLDVGDDRDIGIEHIGGVEPPERSDLDDGHVDVCLRQQDERGRRHQLEPAVIDAGRCGFHDPGNRISHPVVGHRAPVDADALGDVVQVGARVRADTKPGRGQQRGCVRDRRALAVRPGDVNRRKRPLGLTDASTSPRMRPSVRWRGVGGPTARVSR